MKSIGLREETGSRYLVKLFDLSELLHEPFEISYLFSIIISFYWLIDAVLAIINQS